jgi:hypothetical protein
LREAGRGERRTHRTNEEEDVKAVHDYCLIKELNE